MVIIGQYPQLKEALHGGTLHSSLAKRGICNGKCTYFPAKSTLFHRKTYFLPATFALCPAKQVEIAPETGVYGEFFSVARNFGWASFLRYCQDLFQFRIHIIISFLTRIFQRQLIQKWWQRYAFYPWLHKKWAHLIRKNRLIAQKRMKSIHVGI